MIDFFQKLIQSLDITSVWCILILTERMNIYLAYCYSICDTFNITILIPLIYTSKSISPTWSCTHRRSQVLHLLLPLSKIGKFWFSSERMFLFHRGRICLLCWISFTGIVASVYINFCRRICFGNPVICQMFIHKMDKTSWKFAPFCGSDYKSRSVYFKGKLLHRLWTFHIKYCFLGHHIALGSEGKSEGKCPIITKYSCSSVFLE